MSTNETFAGAARLDDWGVIRASGADAAAFLHGQLSNDITGMAPGQARLAAYCTAKGRMLASFIACRDADGAILLACPASVLAATLKRLRMFVLKAKVTLEDAGPAFRVTGVAGAAPGQAVGLADSDAVWSARNLGAVAAVRLPDGGGQPRWLLLGPEAEVDALVAGLPPLPVASWRWLEVRSAVVPVLAETAEQFVPQMINYELVGGVNFKKGCYPGQEIVARSQYLGKLKRRGVLVHADSPEGAARPGQEVFWSEDAAQPSGMVAAAAAAPGGGWDALVELKTSALEGGRLHLGAVDGPVLSVLPLPYAIPDSEN